MVKDESEVDALKRRVDYLQGQHVTLGREHRDEMESKNLILTKRQKRIEKLERDSTRKPRVTSGFGWPCAAPHAPARELRVKDFGPLG